MSDQETSNERFFLVAAEPVSNTRGKRPPTKLMVDVFSENVNIFVSQMNEVLDKTPNTISSFQFVEFEITAEVNGKGQIVIMGTGGEVGLTTGVKFIFRKLPNENRPPNANKRTRNKK